MRAAQGVLGGFTAPAGFQGKELPGENDPLCRPGEGAGRKKRPVLA